MLQVEVCSTLWALSVSIEKTLKPSNHFCLSLTVRVLSSVALTLGSLSACLAYSSATSACSVSIIVLKLTLRPILVSPEGVWVHKTINILSENSEPCLNLRYLFLYLLLLAEQSICSVFEFANGKRFYDFAFCQSFFQLWACVPPTCNLRAIIPNQ